MSKRKVITIAGAAAGVLLVGLVISLYFQLDLPAPTGSYVVGVTNFKWIDETRPEELTDSLDDRREVVAVVWYPAQPDTGTPAPYFPNLDNVGQALSDSGEVSAIEVFGMSLIRSGNLLNAEVSQQQTAYPIIIFSPGNATNVEFYAAIASDLASHRYVVVGLNHPFDVTAVELANGTVVQDASDGWPNDFKARQLVVEERISVRTRDVLFALHQLDNLNADEASLLHGRLDLESVGVMGHSLGGITAARACLHEPRIKACMNLDGLQGGGPFAVFPTADAPTQPFMLITKETRLDESWEELFRMMPGGSYIVTIPAASHDSFTDGPLLEPSLLPVPGKAERITSLVRSYVVAFFDRALKGTDSELLKDSYHDAEVDLLVYPAP